MVLEQPDSIRYALPDSGPLLRKASMQMFPITASSAACSFSFKVYVLLLLLVIVIVVFFFSLLLLFRCVSSLLRCSCGGCGAPIT